MCAGLASSPRPGCAPRADGHLAGDARGRSRIVDILEWSESIFGEVARRRYERLIVTALNDVAATPDRLGSVAAPELGGDVRLWHLRSSRERARGLDGPVRRPRHFIVYRLEHADVVIIVRILHDAMALDRHIPDKRS